MFSTSRRLPRDERNTRSISVSFSLSAQNSQERNTPASSVPHEAQPSRMTAS